jgi:hypothetical protein
MEIPYIGDFHFQKLIRNDEGVRQIFSYKNCLLSLEVNLNKFTLMIEYVF